MAEKCFPFNSVNSDRRYKAEEFAEYFAQLIGTGVIYDSAESLRAKAAGGMSITLTTGGAFIEGRGYINNTEKTFTLDTADGVLNRIDRLVVRCDYTDREIKAQIKKGAYNTTPSAQSLQRDADAYEIAVADIYVGKGVISISQSNITDTRLNSELCGIVTGLIEQADTTELYTQFETYFEEFKQQYVSEMEQWTYNEKNDIVAWLENIKGILDEDAAAHLQNEIEENAQDIFNRYYGLVAGETEFLPDGSIKTNNSEAVIITVFGTNDEGQETVTETIKPNKGQTSYIKVTTFIPATDTTNQKVKEEYHSEL
jgi:hypothetical protein